MDLTPTLLGANPKTRWKFPTKKFPRMVTFQSLMMPIPGLGPLSVDGNCPQTVKMGFMKRILSDTPPLNRAYLRRFKAFVKKFCALFITIPNHFFSFEEWLETTSYSGVRKEQLRRIWKEVGYRIDVKRCRRVKCFVKREVYDKIKHARMILSRIDEFKCFAGPIIKSIEGVLYKLKPFVKHKTMRERARLISSIQNKGHLYMSDYTSYEAHFVREVKKSCEFVLYKHCMQQRLHDYRVLKLVLGGRNSLTTRVGVMCRFDAKRCSGEVDTSCANGFSNLMTTLFLIHERTGCEVCDVFNHYDGYVEGDDQAFTTDVELKGEDYKDLGFTIKIEEIQDMTKGSFCGLVFVNEAEVMRDPRKFLMKFGWAHSHFGCTERVRLELQRAKALSCLYETPQCPIVAATAHKALQLTRGIVPRYEDVYTKPPDEFCIPSFNPSLQTRLAFEKLYGISVSDQLACEKCIMEGDLAQVLQYIRIQPVDTWYWSRYVEAL